MRSRGKLKFYEASKLKPKTSKYQPAGFTLLEVVVAMTIVGLGVVTLLQIFSLGLRLGAKSAAQTEAIAYGREMMDEFLLRQKMEDGSERGSFRDKSRWTFQIQTMRDPSRTLSLGSDWELKELKLDLRVMDGGRERHVELNTLRLMRTKSQ
jgi:prepilin-type N-terminal cleavage/methylation domain-containing protein